ncbi:MAG TPA: cytochrome P450, partial [Candidatus Binatia bacterium]|nr:cytochrome P450 [Candidatus Binatia bacterium]
MATLMKQTEVSSTSTAKEAAGPRELPLLGSSGTLLKDNLKFVMQMARQYGDVARYHMGPMLIYQINHPDGVKHILQDNNHNYTKDTWQLPFMTILLGNGLVMSEGEFWLRERRLMQPTFHRNHVAVFAHMMTETAQAILARWQDKIAENQPLNIHQEMVRLTLDVATQALFSTRVEGEMDNVSAAISFLVKDFSYRFQVP